MPSGRARRPKQKKKSKVAKRQEETDSSSLPSSTARHPNDMQKHHDDAPHGANDAPKDAALNNANNETTSEGHHVSWGEADFLALDEVDDNENDSKEDEQQPQQQQQQQVATTTTTTSSSGNGFKRLPPWMDRFHDFRRIHPLMALHNEIVWFCNLMEPMPDEIRQRRELVEEIKSLVRDTFGEEAEVQVFGSFATGLLLPTSDIDLVVMSKKTKNGKENDSDESEDMKISPASSERETENGDATTTRRTRTVDDDSRIEEEWNEMTSLSPIHRFADAIQSQEWFSRLSYFEIIENTRVPLVKFTVESTNISVDVCFDQTTGPPAAVLMKTYMDAMPPLRPLTFALKYFLAARGLNEPYSGGVGSFMLQLLIVSFLQHRERFVYNYKLQSQYNLGSLLLDFFCLYGLDFNTYTTGISVRDDGRYFPKGAPDRKETFWNPNRAGLLALENPLDPSMDVGTSSFRIQMVQRAFAVAYKTLMSHVSHPFEPTESILASILPVSQEMLDREVLKRRDRALSSKRYRDEENNSTARTSGGPDRKRSRWR